MLHLRHRWEGRGYGREVCTVPGCRRQRFVGWICPRCHGTRQDHRITLLHPRWAEEPGEHVVCELPDRDQAVHAELRSVHMELHELRRAIWNLSAKLAQPAPEFDVDPEHGGVR